MENYYQMLHVARDATESEVCQAYRDAVRRCHPDLHPGSHLARERFLRVQAAFEVLGNPEKRNAYDPDRAPFATPRPAKRKYRRRTIGTPRKEAIVFQRVAWCARRRRSEPVTVSEEAALRMVKAWTFASMTLAYLATTLFLWSELAF